MALTFTTIYLIYLSIYSINLVLEITQCHSPCLFRRKSSPFCQPILLEETFIVRLISIMDGNVAEQRDRPSCIIHTTFSLLSQSVEWSPWSPSHSLLQEPSRKPSAPKVKTFKPSSEYSNNVFKIQVLYNIHCIYSILFVSPQKHKNQPWSPPNPKQVFPQQIGL